MKVLVVVQVFIKACNTDIDEETWVPPDCSAYLTVQHHRSWWCRTVGSLAYYFFKSSNPVVFPPSPLWRCDPTRVMASSFLRFLDHTRRHTTVGRTPLDEWSARCRDLCVTTHNTHNIQTSMPLVGLEPTISAEERPQTYALDCTATGTGVVLIT
jgi:hypothetical protein